MHEAPIPKVEPGCKQHPWKELGHFHELVVVADGELLVNKDIIPLLDEVLCDN